MQVNTVTAKSVLVKSNLPASDFVVNPYGGCTHKCRYCYASFMKRFSGHTEPWGEYLDVKEYSSDKLPKDLLGKTILLSSVTDPYNAFEHKYGKTRAILEMLSHTDANIEILTKSDLVTHDLDLLKTMPHIKVGISLNTLDDDFRKDMEPGAASVKHRLSALKTLHENRISTYLFISPIFPHITNIKKLCQEVVAYVDEICFENLNLKGNAKTEILNYILEKYPQFFEEYEKIYHCHDFTFWDNLEKEIDNMRVSFSVPLISYFYHNKIKKNGGNKNG